jgi:hypothetical protein
MTSYDDGLDRRLTARLDERAAPHAPGGLSEAVTERVSATRQRPAWATTERWISMETRAQFGAVPRAIIVLATLALLTALAAGAIAIGASTTPKLPDPFGAAGNGLIAYGYKGDIYVVEPDGSDLRQITSGPEVERSPSWSRDGTRLAYWTGPEEGPYDLVVIDADGENAVTVAMASRPFSGDVEWSEDGTEIMYDAIVPELISGTCPPYTSEGWGDNIACGSRLFIAATDGSGSRRVGDPGLTARGAVLSPDGWTVAFGGGGDAGSEALYLMDWDGSNVRSLDTGIRGDMIWSFSGQSWFLDGTRIATHDGNGTIWVVNLDEAGALQTADRMGPGYFPVYAPSGGELLLYGGTITDVRGGQAPTVTDFDGEWSPDATELVRIAGANLEVYDRETAGISAIAPADEEERGAASWQRVAR